MDEKMIIGEILKENGRRNRMLAAGVDAGGCLADSPGEMMTGGSPEAGDDEVRRRCREDFAYWAERCVRIKDKMSGRMVPFRLNAPQRRVAGRSPHPCHYAQSAAMGRLHVGADVYGMDSMHAGRTLAFADMRPGRENGGIYPGNV